MNRRRELWTLLIGDFIGINCSWYIFYWLRVQSGWFVTVYSDITPAHLIPSSFVVYGFWMFMFAFFGLYRSWYVRAPFDEVVTVLKTVTVGTLALALALWWDPTSEPVPIKNDTRLLVLIYWSLVTGVTLFTRFLVRFSQHRLLEAGVGRRPSIVIGDVEQAKDLAGRVEHYPRLGYDVIGFVTPRAYEEEFISGNILGTATAVDRRTPSFEVQHLNGKVTTKVVKCLGSTQELEEVIDTYGVKEVLIALGTNEHEALVDVIARSSKSNAGLKIVPDLYDIISGQARTNQIYGFPLIDINPVLLRPWEEAAKRLIDIIASTFLIIAGSPVWLLTALAVRTTSRGPAMYSQERVGKDGEPFKIYKFRSMYTDAEKGGPQWASKNDPRVTPLGRFLRKSHLDEVPQFWNVLKGDMSLVGPRPERPFFVKQLIEEIPYYNRRHKVRPGITGLYQAMFDKYDENMDDVKSRVKYDLMYIESMSFRLDIKILFWTAYKMIRGKGQA